MRLSENVIERNDTNETHHNTSLAQVMSSIPCQYRRAQFPPPLTWMNRVQQAFSSPIHYLTNVIISFNLHYCVTLRLLTKSIIAPYKKVRIAKKMIFILCNN